MVALLVQLRVYLFVFVLGGVVFRWGPAFVESVFSPPVTAEAVPFDLEEMSFQAQVDQATAEQTDRAGVQLTPAQYSKMRERMARQLRGE